MRLTGNSMASRHKINVAHLFLTTGITVAASIGATTAQAQDQGSTGTDIVVTAQKRTQSVNDVGITMNVFSGDALKTQGINTPNDLQQVTPGLVVKDTGLAVPIYTLRGIGFNNIYVNASSTVGLYTDEVAIPYPTMSRGGLFDVERVEVLKGPQGDLYGRNTTAGQINFITGNPTRTAHAGGSIEFGRFNAMRAEAFVSGPVTNGIQVRLAATQSLGGAWQRSLSNPSTKNLGNKDETGLRGKVNFDLGSAGTLLVEGHWVRDQSDGLAATAYDGRTIGLPSAQAARTRYAYNFSTGDNRAADWSEEFRPKHNNRLAGSSAHLNLELGAVDFTSITAYDHYRREESLDNDGAYFNDSSAFTHSRIDTVSQEVRLSSAGKSDFSWIVGAYASHDKLTEDLDYYMRDSGTALSLGVQRLNTKYTQKTDSQAGFVHAEWQITPELQLIGGTRFTHEKRSFTGCTYDVDGTYAAAWNNYLTPNFIVARGLPNPGTVPIGGCAVYDDVATSPTYGTFEPFDDSITANKWMGKFGINFKPSPDLLVYAVASSGFKSGGFNGANANVRTQQAPYKPERLNSLEAGVKSTFRDIGLQLDAAGFYYDYRNKQETARAVTFIGNINALTNIPKSRVFGAEVSGRWQMTDGLAVSFDGLYLNTKILEWQQVSTASSYPTVVYIDSSGMPLPNSPKWTANITPSYKFNVANDVYLEAAADVSYRDRTSGAGRPEQALSSYTLVNARLTLAKQDGAWSVGLWGKNVFNKYYWQYAVIGGNGGYTRLNGMPATYGIRLAVKY